MSEPYLAEIRLFSFNFPPKGWALCNGQVLSINQNQALFSLLGTVYGGNGMTTFALPDLRGRVPAGMGTRIILGASGGEEAHTLTINELPPHSHAVNGSKNIANSTTAANSTWAITAASSYNVQGAVNTGLNAASSAALANTGGGQPHYNMQPFLTLNFCISLQGIYPSRS